MAQLKTYRQLVIWQKSMQLVEEVYKITDIFPGDERFGLISQMRRSVISIPSNIAEGSRRGTTKDFKTFLLYAFSSGAELETQLEIAKRLKFVDSKNCIMADDLLSEVMRMLNVFTKKMS